MQIYLAKQESRIVIALTLSKLKIGIMEKLGRKNWFFSFISNHKFPWRTSRLESLKRKTIKQRLEFLSSSEEYSYIMSMLMKSIHIWRVSLYEEYPYINSIHTWRVSIHEEYPYMKSFHTWRVSIYEEYPYMKCIHTWRVFINIWKLSIHKNIHT